MLKTILRVGIVAVGVAGLASAQQPVPQTPTNPTTPQTTPPATGTVPPANTGTEMMPTAYRAKEILGTRVSLRSATTDATGATTTPGVAGANQVGTVDDIVFGDDGQIEYLIVANEGRLVTVPWQAAKFDLKQKTAYLTVTPEQYRTIPTYTVTTYPSFYTPTYRTTTYRYYGLTPGELRRMERRR